MATHDYVIANGTGAAVRSDLNNALAAIVSNNSSSTEPGTTYAYQWWADTNANVLKIRNSANDGWITLRELDGTMLIEDGSASTPGLAFADDVNTGIFSPAADQIGFATGGVERLEIGSSEVVFNDPSNDVDFRVESNGNTHMLFVDAGNNRVGIGTSSVDELLHVEGSASGGTISAKIQNNVGAASSDAALKLTTNSDTWQLTSKYDGAAFALSNNAGDKLRVDASGRLLVGTSSSLNQFGSEAHLQVAGTDFNKSTIALRRDQNGPHGPGLIFAKSRSSSLGGSTVVQNGDAVGSLFFAAADGTDLTSLAAQIKVEIDGTPGSNDTPGRIMFMTTADSSSTPREHVRLNSSGQLSGNAIAKERVFAVLYSRLVSHSGCNSGGPSGAFTDFDTSEAAFTTVQRTVTSAPTNYRFIGDDSGNAFTFFVSCADQVSFSLASKDSDAPTYRSWVCCHEAFLNALAGLPSNSTRTSLP